MAVALPVDIYPGEISLLKEGKIINVHGYDIAIQKCLDKSRPQTFFW